MPVAAARSRAVRVFLSVEKASIRARTRRAPSHPCTALASGGILTAVALAISDLSRAVLGVVLGWLECIYRIMIITTLLYTVNVSTKIVRNNCEIARAAGRGISGGVGGGGARLRAGGGAARSIVHDHGQNWAVFGPNWPRSWKTFTG